MTQTAKRQITFKLDPEVAIRLDEIAEVRGLSCHETARSLMLSGLAATPRDAAPKRSPAGSSDVLGATLADLLTRLQRIEQAVTIADSPLNVASLLEALIGDQTALLRAARISAREFAHLRSRHLPALRRDIQTATMALLCKGPTATDPEKAAAWVESHLNTPISDLSPVDA